MFPLISRMRPKEVWRHAKSQISRDMSLDPETELLTTRFYYFSVRTHFKESRTWWKQKYSLCFPPWIKDLLWNPEKLKVFLTLWAWCHHSIRGIQPKVEKKSSRYKGVLEVTCTTRESPISPILPCSAGDFTRFVASVWKESLPLFNQWGNKSKSINKPSKIHNLRSWAAEFLMSGILEHWARNLNLSVWPNLLKHMQN